MNDNDMGTKSFESVQPEQPPAKKNGKPDLKKILTISIFSVIIVLLLIFCAIIIAEIVYKVNGDKPADADDIKFTTSTVSSSDYKTGKLLQIDSTYAFDAAKNTAIAQNVKEIISYNSELRITNPNMLITYGVGSKGPYKLLPETIKQFNKFAEALSSATQINDLLVAYAYNAEELAAYDLEHILGTVVDLKREDGKTLAADASVLTWMNENCGKYGFINSDTTGTYHDAGTTVPTTQFRYVGVAHAKYIVTNSLTLKSYLETLKSNYTDPENPLIIDTAESGRYAVYYIPASTSENTDLKVPSNYGYTVSGDNMGGFIVTVDLNQKLS